MNDLIRFQRLTLTYGFAFAVGACGANESPRLPAPDNDQEVSTGYSTEKRDDFTGSVSTLTAADLENQRVSTVEQLLEGRVAGLEVMRHPNGGVWLRIRGARSMHGDDAALVVVDGTPLTTGSLRGALARLAPQDIARIDVLKDAGSTALYGVRGANGVVIITTKRGR